VCSARSGTSKSQGTTSLLLNAIQLVTSGSTNITAIDKAIDIIQDEHVYAAKIAIGAGTNILREVQTSLEQDCEQLRTLLKATWTLGEISDRIQDRVLAAGETLSCRIVAGSLRSKVCSLVSLTLL
jgi:aspartate kinase